MIRSIHIENPRGIRECTLKNLVDVNILIGRNGSGKSIVLEAVYLASSWVNPVDSLRNVRKEDYVVSRRGGRGDWKKFKTSLWFTKDVEKDIIIALEFDSGRELRFRLIHESPSEYVWLELVPKAIPEVDELKREQGFEYPCIRLDAGIYDPRTGKRMTLYGDILEKVWFRLDAELEFLKMCFFSITDSLLRMLRREFGRCS